MISFGTDGWRAVIAEGFTFENVRLVSQATANAILETHTKDTPAEVIIGYDTRFLSDRFAIEVACVMAANNIAVWLSRSDVPTPAVSYNVVHKGANAGIVITASHNPPRYNGFKLKAHYGGSATVEDSERIENHLKLLQDSPKSVFTMDYEQALREEKIRRFDPTWVYYQHLSELIDLDRISQRELKVVCDAMWGAGRGAIPTILSRTATHVTEIRGAMNPGFGGIHPEPITRYLKELSVSIARHGADVGLATDGDADRIGAMDAHGNFVDPHHIMALSLRHLIEQKNLRGDIVKTISTTAMLDRMADKYALKLHETPVGFNHIGDLMMKHDILIGGEESGGISIKGHIPEGDGVLMGLLLLEVMAYAKAPLHVIIADLQATYGPALYAREDVKLAKQVSKKDMVQRLSDSAPSHLNGESVVRINTMDGIKYYMSDYSWLLIRPSGTEPVLRIYAEAPTQEAVNSLLKAGGELGNAVLS